MSTREPEPPSSVHHLPARAAVGGDARAYGGAAHGAQWTVDPVDPPAWVELPIGSSSCLYRLVRHPPTGRPARDHLGNLLYVPLLYVPLANGAPQPDTGGDAHILAFPRGGRAGRWSRRATQHTSRTRRRAGSPEPSTGAAGTGCPLDGDGTG